jgi:hypothetical protein
MSTSKSTYLTEPVIRSSWPIKIGDFLLLLAPTGLSCVLQIWGLAYQLLRNPSLNSLLRTWEGINKMRCVSQTTDRNRLIKCCLRLHNNKLTPIRKIT